jgi:hypothetical protein
MSARPAPAPSTTEAGNADAHRLAEGTAYSTLQSNPLKRTLCVTIRATLNELVSNPSAGKWQPSPDALRSIFQQTQYSDLKGSQAKEGDLSSTVLHSVVSDKVRSTFPCAIGANITGVDQRTFGMSGTPFSTIVLPRESCNTATTLMEDDPAVAIDFMKSYPGYTAHNLETKGVHSVANRGFVLVANEHPLMTAIEDNASTLQLDQVQSMPEGLVKITSTLYDAVMPVVKAQVESQVRVRDYSSANVSIHPSDNTTWQEAMEGLVLSATRPIRAEREHALRGVSAEADKQQIKTQYAAKEVEASNQVQNTPFEFHMMLTHSYDFMS